MGIHLNNSKAPLSSHLDRHENINHGLIRREIFFEILKLKEAQGIPIILETPSGLWKEEVNELLGAI